MFNLNMKNSLIILGIVVLAGIGYFAFVKKSEPTTYQTPTPTATSVKTFSPTANPTTGWKIYTNAQYGFEFKHPNWGISTSSISPINTGLDYNPFEPYILVWAGTTSDAPCADLGCSPKSGDRDELTKGYTLEGAPPLSPWFKILRVRGNKWISIQVTDTNINCSSEAFCQKYLSNAPLQQKQKVNSSDYQTYNDFVDLLNTFKIN